MSETYLEYTRETEELFLRFFMSCPDLFVRCLSIVFPRNFVDQKHRKIAQFILDYANEYRTVPTEEQVEAISGKRISKLDEISESHQKWFLSEYEKFARHKELEFEILASADLLEKSRYGEVETRIKRAVQVALVKDLGTDYFADPRGRLELLLQKDSYIRTGWADLDSKLYGGYTPGSLNVFLGQCVVKETKVQAVEILDLDKYF